MRDDNYPAMTLQDYAADIIHGYYQTFPSQVPMTGVYDMVMSEVELPLLEMTLDHVEGDRVEAAKILGISVPMLMRRLRKYRINYKAYAVLK